MGSEGIAVTTSIECNGVEDTAQLRDAAHATLKTLLSYTRLCKVAEELRVAILGRGAMSPRSGRRCSAAHPTCSPHAPSSTLLSCCYMLRVQVAAQLASTPPPRISYHPSPSPTEAAPAPAPSPSPTDPCYTPKSRMRCMRACSITVTDRPALPAQEVRLPR